MAIRAKCPHLRSGSEESARWRASILYRICTRGKKSQMVPIMSENVYIVHFLYIDPGILAFFEFCNFYKSLILGELPYGKVLQDPQNAGLRAFPAREVTH